MYHKWQSYDVWFLRYQAQKMEFFVILDHFLPFYLPNNTKNLNFQTKKKTPTDIIILHMCIINGNHMKYGSWDIKRDGQNLLSLWTIFPLLPPPPLPPNNPKNQNFQKMNNTLGDIILHMCTINGNWCYGSWDISTTDRFFCHFGSFFALLPP